MKIEKLISLNLYISDETWERLHYLTTPINKELSEMWY